MASVIGLDIGGANLKAAHSGGAARVQGFALWKHAAALPEALRRLLGELPRGEGLAVTMTGELCDCFTTKKEGVRAILAAVAAAAASMHVQVWRNDGRLVSLAAAQEDPLPAAAANWLALATWAGRFAPCGPALLIDVGSTTTDIVPLLDGVPAPRGRTDPDRLRCRELVYTGARRTPLCALLGSHGAAELFATTLDVYLVLGRIDEQPTDTDTADGQPATVAAAHARLARMLCADTDTSTAADRLTLAQRLADRQAALVGEAIQSVSSTLPGRPEAVILSGSGELVARRALAVELPPTLALPPKGGGGQNLVSLAQVLGPEQSAAACAYALAVLSEERA